MNAALRVEALKLVRSPVGVIATAALVGGTLLLVAGMLTAVASGDPELTAKIGSSATFDWAGLLGIAAQITGAGGVLACGVVLAWLFAREFTDGTITGLFALPVGRGQIAAAKLTVYLVWATVVSVAVAAALLLLGLVFGFGLPDLSTWAGIVRQVALGVLTAVIAVPVAWVATASRSLLAGVGSAVAIVVVAQVGVVMGADGWMPLAAPALWAISGGLAVTPIQLMAAVLLAFAIGAGTVVNWRRLQLDR